MTSKVDTERPESAGRFWSETDGQNTVTRSITRLAIHGIAIGGLSGVTFREGSVPVRDAAGDMGACFIPQVKADLPRVGKSCAKA